MISNHSLFCQVSFNIMWYCEYLAAHLDDSILNCDIMVWYNFGIKLQSGVIPGNRSYELDHQCAPSCIPFTK